MIFKYANDGDRWMFIIAVLASLLFGASMPSFCLIFGDMVDGVGGSNSFDMLSDSSLFMVYIGIGVFFVANL
jgi:hypothetical protein